MHFSQIHPSEAINPIFDTPFGWEGGHRHVQFQTTGCIVMLPSSIKKLRKTVGSFDKIHARIPREMR